MIKKLSIVAITAVLISVCLFNKTNVYADNTPGTENNPPSESIVTKQELDRNDLYEWNFEVITNTQEQTKQTIKKIWQYQNDDQYSDFPNLYITTTKQVKTVTNSNNHRRHSLSSRGGLQYQYTRQRVKENITPIIMKYAKAYDLDPHIIRAIIEIESSYNPNAYSYAGACGLMQLKPGTAYDMGVRYYWLPEQNIKAGARYIRLMLDKFGDLNIALAAYNQGPGAVQRAGRKIPNWTAQDYVQKFYEAYKR